MFMYFFLFLLFNSFILYICFTFYILYGGFHTISTNYYVLFQSLIHNNFAYFCTNTHYSSFSSLTHINAVFIICTGRNPGKCPTSHLTPDEIDLLCDTTQYNYPHHLNCKTDADCFGIEKCCAAPHNGQYICRFAE